LVTPFSPAPPLKKPIKTDMDEDNPTCDRDVYEIRELRVV
jgi:hypothetical protein